MEFLSIPGPQWEVAADGVAILADSDGHFAPYPGGGGCYDYDAVFLLTANQLSITKHSELLRKTSLTLLMEQNPDGGFCESLCIRPRTILNFLRSCQHVINSEGIARLERLRHTLTLLRPKYDRINTHWSIYSREWGESDLWDSWFRMLAIARIEVALNPEKNIS